MNALAFVCVAVKIGQKASPRTQLELLGQAMKKTRAAIKEASSLGIDVQGFEDALRGCVSASLSATSILCGRPTTPFGSSRSCGRYPVTHIPDDRFEDEHQSLYIRAYTVTWLSLAADFRVVLAYKVHSVLSQVKHVRQDV